MTQTPDFFVSGLDLGQKRDFTCLITLAGVRRPEGRNHYVGRGLKRWPLGTSYAAIVADLKKLFGAEPLKGSALAVDRTGCGQPVIDMIQAARVGASRTPILITGGHRATKDDEDGGYHVPKLELAATVAVLLESDRIEFPATLPHRDVLV